MEDKQRTDANKATAKINPKAKATWLSNIFFFWEIRILFQGYRKPYTEDDLFDVLENQKSSTLGDELESAWNSEITNNKHPSLWKALIRVFAKDFILYSLLTIPLELAIKPAIPVLMGKILSYYQPNQTSVTKEETYIHAGLYMLTIFLRAMFFHNYTLKVNVLAMKVKIAVSSLIYRKALEISTTTLTETSVGQIVNLLSNDVNRFSYAGIFLPYLVIAPMQFAIAVYLLYLMLGITTLAGMTLLLIFIMFIIFLIAKIMYKYRQLAAAETDKRIQLINEIICGIKVIKMYTWEKPFSTLVDSARRLELKQVALMSYVASIYTTFSLVICRLALYICIAMFIISGNSLTSLYTFTCASFFETLRQGFVNFLPGGVRCLSDIRISVQRIEQFLKREDFQCKSYFATKTPILRRRSNKIADSTYLAVAEQCPKNIGVRISSFSTKWIKSSSDFTLKGVNLDAELNQLVAVIGPVGSGKTTLLHTVLKELDAMEGKLEVNGRISYSSQDPWIFASSIKQNILFGENVDTDKYNRVVSVCGLDQDFSALPYGDRSLVGERGVMLSGGQKARINLARSIYKDADIYLLDDPFSALDSKVGKEIFQKCILNYLNGKCVVLVTHQFQYLKDVDKIYFLKNGRNVATGTFSEIRETDDEFLNFLHKENEDKCNNEAVDGINVVSFQDSAEVELPQEIEEHRTTGNFSYDIFYKYFRASNNTIFCCIVLSLVIIAQALGSCVDYYVVLWVNAYQDAETNKTNPTFFESEYTSLYVYTGLIATFTIVAFARSTALTKFCMIVSRNLHNFMFSKIVYGFMQFFNTNPSGRILNRFSNDIGAIDDRLPSDLLDAFQIMLHLCSVIILVSVVNIWLLMPAVVLLAIIFTCHKISLKTSTNLKRIEGRARSPLLSHLNASLQGVTTIKSFGASAIMKTEFEKIQNIHTSVFYTFTACNATFGFWLDLVCVIYTGLAIIILISVEQETYGGNIGLVITQLLSLIGQLQYGMRTLQELESEMTSVERVLEYIELPLEEDDDEKMAPPKSWPNKGQIEFKQISMRYSDNGPFILNNIRFKIQPKEKIGIVGRTGAGKSSLIAVLFRLTNFEGQLFVDDVDTKEISLKRLRSKLSIIPQEPVLFSETLRKNLDPFNEYEDSVLWHALEEVELKNKVSGLLLGLQSKVSEGGSNFSVGERQLLCLARAVIHKNKILVLDEATANVDPHTDKTIQQTIRRKFCDCTVLTIAHRLQTVMDSDKILVMDSGSAVEFDRPSVLLQNKRGIFYQLVMQSGTNVAQGLTAVSHVN